MWVEGSDDERFFEGVLKRYFQSWYNDVRVIKYAEMPKGKMKKYFESIRSINGADYILLVDLNGSPCVTARKQKTREKFSIEEDKIVVVVQEIESWYLAGLNDSEWKRLGIKGRCPATTDDVTKEVFNSISGSLRGRSRIELMQEILEVFSTEVAMRKNRSFQYFMKKYCFNRS